MTPPHIVPVFRNAQSYYTTSFWLCRWVRKGFFILFLSLLSTFPQSPDSRPGQEWRKTHYGGSEAPAPPDSPRSALRGKNSGCLPTARVTERDCPLCIIPSLINIFSISHLKKKYLDSTYTEDRT